MKISTKLFTFIMAAFLVTSQVVAQSGALNLHDPSSIVKDKNKYWVYSTGDGISMASSNDLYKWTSSPNGVFAHGDWPKWINYYIPGFAGEFWAPECIYMNGKYYLYYSCSLPFSPRSVIGLATNTTLDPANPNYKWVDEGPVVRSLNADEFNAIDPAVLLDDDGRVYLTYGSYHKGIGVVELNRLTGKVPAGLVPVKVAGYGPGEPDWEAAFMFKNEKYYYMVANRAGCCKNLESTYFMVVGRSESPFGPFIDDNGIDLKEGGGKHLIGTSGRFISPGHFGLLKENGANFVSMHFYDGKNIGRGALDVANLKFTDGWPVITRDWIPAGRYKITNQHSGLVWDSYGCNGQKLEGIAQNGYNGLLCQKWDFAPLGDGVYKITCARGYGSVDALCNPLGSKMLTMTWLNTDCQKFKIDRTGDGSYLFTSMSTNKLVEVPAASTNGGTFIGLYDHTGHSCQRWFINKPGSMVGNNEAPMYVVK